MLTAGRSESLNDRDGGRGTIHSSDTTAQIFWLKNRKPAEWRDKQNIEVEQSKPFEVSITVVD